MSRVAGARRGGVTPSAASGRPECLADLPSEPADVLSGPFVGWSTKAANLSACRGFKLSGSGAGRG